jgi:hypothetical protein
LKFSGIRVVSFGYVVGADVPARLFAGQDLAAGKEKGNP